MKITDMSSNKLSVYIYTYIFYKDVSYLVKPKESVQEVDSKSILKRSNRIYLDDMRRRADSTMRILCGIP